MSDSAAIAGYVSLVAAAYLAIVAGVALRILPLPALLGVLTVPMARNAFKVLRRHHAFPYRLIPANATTIFIHLFTGVLLAIGYVLAGISERL
jgi:1,4-dihydroxy-2-naphthoate octaprenyltransferase